MIGDLKNSLSNKEFTGTITMLGGDNPKKVIDMDDWDNDMEIPEAGLSLCDHSKSFNYNNNSWDDEFLNSNDPNHENVDITSLKNIVVKRVDLPITTIPRISSEKVVESANIMSGASISRNSSRFNIIVSPSPSSSNFESEDDESFDDLHIPDSIDKLTLFPPRREYQNSPLSQSDTIKDNSMMDYKLYDDDGGDDNFWAGLDVQDDNAFEPDNIKNKNIVPRSVPLQQKRPRRQSFTIEFSPSLVSDSLQVSQVSEVSQISNSLMNVDVPQSFDINSCDEFSHSKDSSSTSEKSTASTNSSITSKNGKSSSHSLSKSITRKNCLSSLVTPPSSPTKVVSHSKKDTSVSVISKRPSIISSKTSSSPPLKKCKSNMTLSKSPDSSKPSSYQKEKDSTKSSTKSSAIFSAKSSAKSSAKPNSKSSAKSNAKSSAKSNVKSSAKSNAKSSAKSVTKSVTKNSTTSKSRTSTISKVSNTNDTSSVKENFNPLTKSKKSFVTSNKSSSTNKSLISTRLLKVASSPSLKTEKLSGDSSLTKHVNISSVSLAS
ncbi:5084_t:CDS:2, partial [Dentiscutata heterogama]